MNDLFDYQFDILKSELSSIDSSIRKVDDIGNSVKNWAILTWTGAVTLFLKQPELHHLVLFTAFPPLAFMVVDAHWRKVQRRFAYRQGLVSSYLNSSKFRVAVENRRIDFPLLDPIARNDSDRPSLRRFVSVWRLLRFPTVSLIYLSLSLMSLALAILMFWFGETLGVKSGG